MAYLIELIITLLNDPRLVLLFVWFVEISLLRDCYQVQAAVADPQPKHLLFGWRAILRSMIKYLKEAVAYLTWVQSTIATRHGFC